MCLGRRRGSCASLGRALALCNPAHKRCELTLCWRLLRSAHPVGLESGPRLRRPGPVRIGPYQFEIEPTLFVSDKGQVSARFTGTYDVLLSQRLIMQPRFETNVAVQRDEEVGIAAGWNDAELGVRLRYEVRRELAPYVGATWKESFGATHRLTTQGGGDPSHFVVVAGLRAWF